MRLLAAALPAGLLLALSTAASAQSNVSTQTAALSAQSYQALHWRLVGPFRGGRVTAVAGHPSQPTTFYMGATGGGVWKTTDAGQTWENISDGAFTAGSIGAITVAPSNPQILYVGTGEAPVRGVATSSGDGVYRSDDGGKSWRRIGLPESRHISRIVVHPANPELVWVAVQGDAWGDSDIRGVYRSRDGGRTWQRSLFVNPSTGPSDLVMDAANPDILYAATWDYRRKPWTIRSGGPGSGIWKSTDGGESWIRLAAGLPKLMGRIGVAVSPARPNRLWAMIEAVDGGVYRSDDAGLSWIHVNDDPGPRDRGWYYSHIYAHPTDPNQVYVLAAPMVVSHDGGKTFTAIPTPHGDNHGLWINPRQPEVMIQSNDGGANVTFNGGRTWSTQMNQPTGQFYRIETDDRWPYRIYSAQQDSSSVSIASRTVDGGIGGDDWHDVGGGESAFLSTDPHNPVLVYGTGLLGGLTEYDDRTGVAKDIDPYPVFAGFRRGMDLKYRFNWNAPVLVSRHDPNVIYHGANKLLKSVDRGLHWAEISPDLTRARPATMGTTGGPIMIEGAGGEHYATLTYIAESPRDAGVIWTGSDDGLVHVTRDGGKHWADVTPSRLPEAQVNAIEVSPHDPGTAYIAVHRYKLDDLRPYAYKTTDYGKSWTSIITGMAADDFVRVIREDPVRRGLLYAGTQHGALVSFDAGQQWQPLQLDLPVVPVTDLQVHGDDLVAATEGRAIWVLDGLEPLRELTPANASAPVHLFTPAPALRLEGGGRPGISEGRNPPDGAVIYYSFAEPPQGEIMLELLDEQGTVLRRFSSEAQRAQGQELVKGAQGEPPAAPLPKKAGLNRYVWNLRVEPMVPVADTIRFVRNRPYRVAPSRYRVRLTVGGNSYEQPLDVMPHPGVPQATPAQWETQQRLSRTLYEMVNDVHRETNGLRALASRAAARAPAAPASERKRIDAFVAAEAKWEAQVPQAPLPGGVQDRIGFPSRLLSTQILHTLSILDEPPPVPAAVEARVAELQEQWAGLKAEAVELRAEGGTFTGGGAGQ